MKINQIPGVSGAYLASAARKAAKGQEPAPAARQDSVQLSPEAQKALAMKEKLAQSADVRTERIQELRRQIEAGTYRPDSRQVADKMLKARVFDNSK